MRRNTLTADLFEVPVPAPRLPGDLAMGVQVRHQISELLKHSMLSRYEIAAHMSELTGEDISKHQLDSWTAESRSGWRFPLEYLPALEVALDSHVLTQWIGSVRGCKVLVGREAIDAEMGKIKKQQLELARREKALKKLLEGE
ncbi:MAG: hypothetical protein ACYCY1_12615 [Sulfuriferula sp.]